jgi:hypothetical protein
MAVKEIILRVRADGTTQAQTAFGKLGDAIHSSIGKYVAFGTAIYAAKKLIVGLTESAVKLEGVQNAFKRIGSPELLKNLKEATGGMVDDFVLMQKAVMAANLGLPLEKLGDAMRFAQLRARETGRSVDELIEDIALGIGKQSPRLFDNLGISSKRVEEEFKRTGNFGQAAFKIINEELVKMNKNFTPFTDQVNLLRIAWENYKDAAADSWKWTVQTSPIWQYVTKRLNEWAEATVAETERMKGLVKEGRGVGASLRDHAKDIKHVTTAYEEWLIKLNEAIAKEQQEARFLDIYGESLQKRMGLKINPGEMFSLENTTFTYKKQQKELEKITVKEYDFMEKAALEYADKVQNITNRITDMWSQAMINQWQSGESFFTNMARGFEQMLASMAASMMGKSILWGILSMFTGGTALLGAKNFGSFLFGAQHGADFRVGGSGGTDSQLVAFRASPGERVTVTPPGQNVNNSSISISIEGHIVDSRLIQRELIPALKRAQRLGYQ